MENSIAENSLELIIESSIYEFQHFKGSLCHIPMRPKTQIVHAGAPTHDAYSGTESAFCDGQV